MVKNFFVSPFWGKIFNRYTFTKIFIIFIIGFITRVFISAIFGVNVVWEFTSFVSIVYFSFMAFFGYVVHEAVPYFDFCIFPKFVIDFFIGIPRINFSALEFSSIKNAVSCYFDYNKIKLSNFDSNNFFSNNEINKRDIKVNTFLMKNTIDDSNTIDKNVNNSEGSSNDQRNYQNNNYLNVPNSNVRGNSPRDFIMMDSDIGLGFYPDELGYLDTINDSNRQLALNNGSSHMPIMPARPNPYENLSTPSLSSNSIRFPSFGDDASNITPSEIETPRNSMNIGVSQTNLSSTNTNYTNHATIGSLNSAFSTNYTNDTNHGTLGTNEYFYRIPTPSERGLEYRRQQIVSNHRKQVFANAMNDTVNDFTNVEMDVSKEGVRGKVKLGLKYLGSKVQHEISKLDSIYVKYHDVGKRHFYWTVWEKKRGTYISYSEFKKDWDSNISIWEEIKDKLGGNIKDKVDKLIHEKDPFNRRLNNKNIGRILSESKYKGRRR